MYLMPSSSSDVELCFFLDDCHCDSVESFGFFFGSLFVLCDADFVLCFLLLVSSFLRLHLDGEVPGLTADSGLGRLGARLEVRAELDPTIDSTQVLVFISNT